MISSLQFLRSPAFDPYANMATELFLTKQVGAGTCLLYLWQNERTVFIGKNQNCFAECNVGKLEEEGGNLCRRVSGGGAVYHDTGNLNFTFCVRKEDYDVAKQCKVIADAVSSFGIHAEVSGRNDLLAEGGKFSGNAFYRVGDCHFHHGTILIRSDVDAMSRYLTVSKDKLESKGVASVRARVVNLSDLNPSVTPNAMAKALFHSFGKIYGLQAETVPLPTQTDISSELAFFKDPSWIYGRNPNFSNRLQKRFPWGGVTVSLEVCDGVISDCEIHTDALETEWVQPLKQALLGAPYHLPDLLPRLSAFPNLLPLFKEQI